MAECEAPTHGADFEALVQEAVTLTRGRSFTEARAAVERFEAIDADDPFGAHARIHFHIDEGSFEEGVARGIDFLESHDPFEGINVHNAMHLATLLVDLARAEASVAWQVRVVVPIVEKVSMQYASAAHLMWHTEVCGYGRAAGRVLPWDILVRPGVTSLNGPNDVPHPLDAIAHAMAWIANGDGARRHAHLADLVPHGYGDGHPASVVGLVAKIIDGLHAWWEGDVAGAADLLGAAREGFAPLTAYADLLHPIEDTLIDAEWRTRCTAHGESILRQRIDGYPVPRPRDQAWLARLLAADGRHDEASALARAAVARWSGGDADSSERTAVALLA